MGSSMDEVKVSAFLERLTKKGLEVLFLTDPIDEYAIQNLTEFDGKKLQSVTKEGLKFGDVEDIDAKRADLYKEQYKPLTKWMKGIFSDTVEKISVSTRLDTTPCIFVTSQYGYSANMERIMHDTALLNSGFPVADAKLFSQRMYRMLKNGLALDSLDLAPEIEVPEEPEEEEEEEAEEAEVEDAEAEGEEKEEM